MTELFSEDWAQEYMLAWNANEDITSTLASVGWSSVVGFGFQDEAEPAFVMTITNGEIISITRIPASDLQWDLRATKENWLAMVAKPPGLMKLGIAYTSRKLRFVKGDYASMVKDPNLASAFVKSFALMAAIS